jgi:hypothetical protein
MAGTDPASILLTLSAEFSRIHRIQFAEVMGVAAKDCLGSKKQVELVFER